MNNCRGLFRALTDITLERIINIKTMGMFFRQNLSLRQLSRE